MTPQPVSGTPVYGAEHLTGPAGVSTSNGTVVPTRPWDARNCLDDLDVRHVEVALHPSGLECATMRPRLSTT
jgi:hypothetical protein